MKLNFILIEATAASRMNVDRDYFSNFILLFIKVG